MKLQHKDQRIAVLIDVQNMYYSAKFMFNSKVNFKEILSTAVAGRKLIRAIAYAIRAEMKDEALFHDALENIGIEVKSKQLLQFHGGAKKGDWDIGLAMDAVRLSQKVDTMVIVSGDGDFKDLLQWLKSHGLRTEVIAFSKTASINLKEEADHFFDMEKDKKKFLIPLKKKPFNAYQQSSDKPYRPQQEKPGYRQQQDKPQFRQHQDKPNFRPQQDKPNYQQAKPSFRPQHDKPSFRQEPLNDLDRINMEQPQEPPKLAAKPKEVVVLGDKPKKATASEEKPKKKTVRKTKK